MAWTKFGPGTLTYTIAEGTATEFAQEVRAVTIAHEYEEVGEAVTYLDGTSDVPGSTRNDSVTAECDFDLGSAGFYNFLFQNDGATATVSYIPSTADGATWGGAVQLRLPEDVAAEGFGAKLTGSVTHPFVGPVSFTPAGQPLAP